SVAPPAAIVRPVLTSSKMRTIPRRFVNSRTASRYPGSGGTIPRFIIAASMMTQAGAAPPGPRPSSSRPPPRRDHPRIVVAVVRADDLDDRVASGQPPGDPDGIHRRFGAGVRVAPFRQAPAALQLLSDRDGVLGRRGEMGAGLDAPLDGVRDRGVGVALRH